MSSQTRANTRPALYTQYSPIIGRKLTSGTSASPAAVSRKRRNSWPDTNAVLEHFRHKRAFPSGEVQTFRSDFYTGEAIFGSPAAGSGPPRKRGRSRPQRTARSHSAGLRRDFVLTHGENGAPRARFHHHMNGGTA